MLANDLQISKYCVLVSFYYKICFQSICTIFIYQRMLNIPWGRILDMLYFSFYILTLSWIFLIQTHCITRKNGCWHDAYKADSFRLSTKVRRLRKSFFVLFILIVKPCLNNRMTWLCYFLLVPKDIEHASQFQCLTKKKKLTYGVQKFPSVLCN